MSPDDVIRLRHMADAAESALRFCQGRTRADLDTDDMLRFALTRAVEIVGEAANKVSNEPRTQTPGIVGKTEIRSRALPFNSHISLANNIGSTGS